MQIQKQSLVLLLLLIIAGISQSSVYNASLSSLNIIPDDIDNSVTVLDLQSNQISEVGAGDLSAVNLQKIDLRKNNITYFDQDAFCTCMPNTTVTYPDIEELFLGYNELTSFPDVPDVGSGIRILDLSYNRLEDVSPSLISNLNSLEELYLEGNPLLWHDELDHFEDLGTTLMILDLTGTAEYATSRDVDVEFLEVFIKLEELYLNNLGLHEVSKIDNSEIRGTLRILDLGHNFLSNFDMKDLNGLDSIHTLILNDNKLSRFPSFASAVRNSIQILNLGGQSVDDIASALLDGMIALQRLDVGDNELGTFPIFPHEMTALTFLNVSHNMIDDLSSPNFENLPSLVHLDISYNRITVVPAIANLYATHTNALLITGETNPFHCDCDFNFTLLASDAYNQVPNIHVTLTDVPCTSPPEYLTTSYKDIHLGELCPRMFTEHETTAVLEITLSSKVSPVPETSPVRVPTTETTALETITLEKGTSQDTTTLVMATLEKTTSLEMTTLEMGRKQEAKTSLETTIEMTTKSKITSEVPTTDETRLEETSMHATPGKQTASETYRTTKAVLCKPFPVWLDIQTDDTEAELGHIIVYKCKDGYQFEDLMKGGADVDEQRITRTSKCSISDGLWRPKFVGCLEVLDLQSEAQYWEPVEAENAEFIGLAAIIFLVIETLVLVILDVPTCYNACRVCRKSQLSRCLARSGRAKEPELDDVHTSSTQVQDILPQEV